MSSFNAELNKLAKERASRAAASTTVDEIWSCPVCYTDGSSSGHVIPKCCTHKICLDCYSNILTKTTNCICPVCRAEYRPSAPAQDVVNEFHTPHQEHQQEASSDIYVNQEGRLMLRASSIPHDILLALRTRRRRTKHANNAAVEPPPEAPKSILENAAGFFTSFFA